ncbi:hypothetical protein C8R44DRAFT_98476 [Mycena epipterygia]|nr:hypothetical protein C8R44DRAFT_98476 [Mycena epipterygia]
MSLARKEDVRGVRLDPNLVGICEKSRLRARSPTLGRYHGPPMTSDGESFNIPLLSPTRSRADYLPNPRMRHHILGLDI